MEGTENRKKREVVLNGKTVAVTFNMNTLLSYEEITGKSFFGEDFNLTKEQLALIYAAAVAADSETTLTVDDLLNSDDWDGVKAAFETVMELASEFFHLPTIIDSREFGPDAKEDADGDDAGAGDGEKN